MGVTVWSHHSHWG